MHHALHIQEILLHIFSYCYTLGGRSPRSRKQLCYANVDLAALARTRKAFKDPALDMIWAELDNLVPLMRCLDQSSVNPEGEYSLKESPEQNEWDIFLGYARRVRALPCLHGSLDLAADCIEALSNPPISTSSIFPNLRVVGLHNPSATVAPFIRHLANPNLTDITFERMENLGGVIDTFGEGCPNVSDFHVSQWADANIISDLICHWKNLLSVSCHEVGLNVDALSHLSCLHNLRYLRFRVHDAVVDQIHATQSPTSTLLTFPALRHLLLTSGSLTPISGFLHRFHIPATHNLFVGLDARPTASDLMSFFMALREACTRKSMTDLLLRVFDFGNESNVASAENPPPYYITFGRLRPLTSFVNIEYITLDIPCGADLNETEFLSLASSWPHLESFEVGKNYDWPASSAITPGGFLQLLERCRSLRVLHFMFDTHGYTEIPQGHPWRGLTMPQHTFIHLLNSPVDEESIEALGVFFHVAPYPNFSLTTHWNNRYFRGSERPQELCDLYYDRWVEARTLARDLWEERRDLRCSLETRSLQHYSP